MTCCAHMEGVHAGSASHMEHMVENSRSEKEKSILSPRSEDEMCVFTCVCVYAILWNSRLSFNGQGV